MVQGIRVGESLPISFFSSSLYLPFCSSSPISASIARDGVDGFALYPDLSFLPSSPSFFLPVLSLFLALLRADPAVAGFWSLFNK